MFDKDQELRLITKGCALPMVLIGSLIAVFGLIFGSDAAAGFGVIFGLLALAILLALTTFIVNHWISYTLAGAIFLMAAFATDDPNESLFTPYNYTMLALSILLICFLTFKLARHYLAQKRNAPELSQTNENDNFDAIEDIYLRLKSEPETPKKTITTSFPLVSSETIHRIATEVFKDFINEGDIKSANALLNYYPVDEHDILNILRALDAFNTTGELEVKPQAFKINLGNSETAYEKLPCNWQKIHTYLAPLENEIEQADILDSGNIYITDQRVFFVGKKGSETVYLKDIAYMNHKEDALQFFRDEGLSEIFAFPTPHHATYARLVIEELLKPSPRSG